MKIRTRDALISAPDHACRPARLCAVLFAAALLGACSSQSWRSSSAMWSDRNAGRAEAADAGGITGSQDDAGQAAATAPQEQEDSLAAAGSRGGADTAQQYESPPTEAHEADTGTTGESATGESSPSPGSDGAADQGLAATDADGGDQDADLMAGQQGAADDGTASSSMGSASEDAMAASGADTDSRSGALAEADSATAQGATEQGLTGAAVGDEGAADGGAEAPTAQDSMGTAAGEQTGADTLSETGAERDLPATGAVAQDGAGAVSAEAAEAAGEASSTGTGGAAAAAYAGSEAPSESAGGSDQAAVTPAPSTSGAGGSTQGGAGSSTQQQEVIVGMVEAPGRKATPTETVIPQTLGGILPLTLGVEGEGEFDFDRAVLREQVKSVLDEVAARLRDAEYDRLEIVGHADRVGTETYNQYLSERRAWAVARYLVQQGVPVTKLVVEGRGMHEPLSSVEDCTGLGREETIECLQRDRRVVISASIRRVDVNVH